MHPQGTSDQLVSECGGELMILPHLISDFVPSGCVLYCVVGREEYVSVVQKD